MSVIGSTYSFKALTGAFTHPLAGTLVFGGQIGSGQIVVQNATDHTSHDTAADGTVMPSFIAGDSGGCTIECQQTSLIHLFLLGWLNLCKTAAMNDDVSNWANGVLLLRDSITGVSHELTGVSPMKSPDKTYAAQGGKITWTLPACNVVNL